jgi:hypothetical protein
MRYQRVSTKRVMTTMPKRRGITAGGAVVRRCVVRLKVLSLGIMVG